MLAEFLQQIKTLYVVRNVSPELFRSRLIRQEIIRLPEIDFTSTIWETIKGYRL